MLKQALHCCSLFKGIGSVVGQPHFTHSILCFASSPYLLADDLLAIVHCLEEMGHLVEALACLLMCPIQSSKTVVSHNI